MLCKTTGELIERLQSMILDSYTDYNIKVGDKLDLHNIVSIEIDKNKNLILITDL